MTGPSASAEATESGLSARCGAPASHRYFQVAQLFARALRLTFRFFFFADLSLRGHYLFLPPLPTEVFLYNL
jgi:hypothetical protein